MTKDDLVSKDTALKMAIEALEFFQQHSEFWKDTADEAINACKEALATEQVREDLPAQLSGNSEQLKQDHSADSWKIGEPVAWTDEYKMFLEWDKESLCDKAVCKEYEAIPLYTHPHQWQGLTDDEIWKIFHDYRIGGGNFKQFVIDFANIIEQELKTKNGFSGLKDKNT